MKNFQTILAVTIGYIVLETSWTSDINNLENAIKNYEDYRTNYLKTEVI